ncbi:MAG: response regulator [Bryobacterales bacterium]|nr:response regulator [Bryobacterales bacterium]
MATSDTPTSRRAVIISPNSPLVSELEPLLAVPLAGTPLSRLQSYPSPRDLPSLVGGGILNIVFLDTSSDPEQALQLLGEMSRMGAQVQVVALLGGNDPDFILRCLRAGASDFLIQPFTPEEVKAALGKLARVQPVPEAIGKDSAKVISVMPAKGACGATTLASNLAFQWKRVGGKRVLLVDLDTNRVGRWKVRLVVNRYLRDVGLSREVIGTALHTEVFETLPSDYEGVQKALMDGKPIPASSTFGKGIVQLVDRLGGKAQPTTKKASSLSGLLGLFSKTSK